MMRKLKDGKAMRMEGRQGGKERRGEEGGREGG